MEGGVLNRLQRNMREKHRRRNMRILLQNLSSSLPNSAKSSVPNLIEEATSHIKKMKVRLDELETTKMKALLGTHYPYHPTPTSSSVPDLPILHISTGSDSTLELNLFTALPKHFMIHEVIRILQQEGAEVTCFSSCHTASDRVIYTIKCQAMIPRIGINTSNVVERLQELVCSNLFSSNI